MHDYVFVHFFFFLTCLFNTYLHWNSSYQLNWMFPKFGYVVEMLPMPNPYVPEEHDPWCPYGVNSCKKFVDSSCMSSWFVSACV